MEENAPAQRSPEAPQPLKDVAGTFAPAGQGLTGVEATTPAAMPPATSTHTPPQPLPLFSVEVDAGVGYESNAGVPPGATPIALRESVRIDGGDKPPPSGTTVIVPPQEQPPQTVGMSARVRGALQGRAALTVTFADGEAVKQWLNGQSPETALVFAARVALRIVPTITFGPWPGSGRKTTREIVSRVFRAVAAAWAVAAYPGQRDLLRNTARAALFGLGDVQAPSPVRAAAYASAAATGGEGVSSRASTSVGYALDAAGSEGRDALDAALKAMTTDAQLLDQGFSPVTLANSKLWPGQIPDWVSSSWSELRFTLLDADEDWHVWTSWYEERLAGVATNQDTEVARLRIDDRIWEQQPRVVNAHIKELIEERGIFQHATADEPEDDLPDDDAIPEQAGGASQFTLDAEGRIDLVPDPAYTDGLQRAMYQEVRLKAVGLSALGHNQLADLSEPIGRFLAAAPERIEDASISRLWSRGNTLRLRLKAHDTAATSTDPTDPTDPALLPTLVTEMLRDLVETYNIFIAGDATGRELDQVRLGPQERLESKAAVDAAVPIVEAVRVSDRITTAGAVETLIEQIEAARDAPAGVDGDQAIELSRKTNANFVVTLVRSGLALLRGEAGFALEKARGAVYGAAGTGAIYYRNEILTFIRDNAVALRTFVEHVFHNPTLIQIIDLISNSAVS
jgi:hypothetical protein